MQMPHLKKRKYLTEKGKRPRKKSNLFQWSPKKKRKRYATSQIPSREAPHGLENHTIQTDLLTHSPARPRTRREGDLEKRNEGTKCQTVLSGIFHLRSKK